MVLLDLMDAIKVHALAVTTGIDSDFTDTQVGFPPAKGRSVRIFYAGERDPERFESSETLTSKLVAQGIGVRGYWPVASTSPSEQRIIEGQMAAFAKQLRIRLLGDSRLTGKAQDGLKMHLAAADQVSISGTQYAVVDIEIVVDYDEFSVAVV